MLAVTVLLSYYTGRFHNALKYTLLDIGLIIFFFVLLYFVYLQNKKMDTNRFNNECWSCVHSECIIECIYRITANVLWRQCILLKLP